MAFSAVTARGSAVVGNLSGSSISMNPSANLTVGKVVFVCCASVSHDTTDGASTQHTAVSDSKDNTWTKITEYTETSGVLADGTTVSTWWTKITTQINTTDTITLNLANAKLERLICAFEATVGTGKTVSVAQTGVRQNDIVADVSALTSREYLLVGNYASRGNDNSKTPDADYTEQFDLRTRNNASAITNHVQTRIATLTADTCTSTNWTTNIVAPMAMLHAVYEVNEPVLVSQSTETDTSQTSGIRKDRATNYSEDKETANDVGRRKEVDKAQVTESNTAFAITRNKRKEIGQVTETDSLFNIGIGISISYSSETDSAQILTITRRITLGQATETDSANDITRISVTKYIDVGTAFPSIEPLYDIDGNQIYDVDGNPIFVPTDFNLSKTDRAQRTTVQKRLDLDYAEEINSAKDIFLQGLETKYINVGVAFPEYEYLFDADGNQILDSEGNPIILPTDFNTSHTDFALSVTEGISGIQHATETDTPIAITSEKRKTLNYAEETDSVFGLTTDKYLEITQATETDEAQGISQKLAINVGIAYEIDIAESINAPNMVEEFDSAFAITAQRHITINQVTETDSAQAITSQKRIAVNQATETDTCYLITNGKDIPVDIVIETNEAQLFTILKQCNIGLASETDSVYDIYSGGTKFRDIGTVTETDRAITIRTYDIDKLAKCVKGYESDYDLDTTITYYQTSTVEDYEVEATVELCAGG